MINLINLNSIQATKPSFLLETILPIQEREINLFSSVGGGGKSWTLLKTLALLNTVEKKRVFGWIGKSCSYSKRFSSIKLSFRLMNYYI